MQRPDDPYPGLHCCVDTPPGLTPAQEAIWQAAWRAIGKAVVAVASGTGYGDLTVQIQDGRLGLWKVSTTHRPEPPAS